MVKVHLKFDQGIPQYACSSCNNCYSVFGKSLCSIKNRGCCWYFPKFTLHEIHKMVRSKEGQKTLYSVLSLPKIRIYNYYIHAIGHFDEVGYKRYLESEQIHHINVADKSIFFRTCPFVKSGVGCTLPKKYRSYVCNFYICDEIIKDVEKYDGFQNYIKERNSYIKWTQWENYSIEMLLREKGLNLVSNFDEVINLLENIPLENYEFPHLDPIEVVNADKTIK